MKSRVHINPKGGPTKTVTGISLAGSPFGFIPIIAALSPNYFPGTFARTRAKTITGMKLCARI